MKNYFLLLFYLYMNEELFKIDCQNLKVKDLCSKYEMTNYAINKLKTKLGIVKNKSKQSVS